MRGHSGEQHTALLEKFTKWEEDSLIWTENIFTPSVHGCLKFWRPPVHNVSIVWETVTIMAWYFLVWELQVYGLEGGNQALSYGIYFRHIYKYVMSTAHLVKQISQFNKSLKWNDNKSFTLLFASIVFCCPCVPNLAIVPAAR